MPPASASVSTVAAIPRSNLNSNALQSLTDVLLAVQERRTETLQSMQDEHDSTAKWLQETIQVRSKTCDLGLFAGRLMAICDNANSI